MAAFPVWAQMSARLHYLARASTDNYKVLKKKIDNSKLDRFWAVNRTI